MIHRFWVAKHSGVIGDLWLYWSATFIGTSLIAFALRGKFKQFIKS
jgi:hypothetical protein